MAVTFILDSGVERNAHTPDTFQIPSEEKRTGLKRDDLAKLIFRIQIDDEEHVERMWVRVTEILPEYYVGLLDNDPICTNEIRSGMTVVFHSDHVIQIDHIR